MFLLVLAVLSPVLGARPGFQSTGTIEWRDCSVGAPWVKVNKFDISPSPIKLPGDMTVALEGTIDHILANSVTLDVLMEKELLGKWTKVVCAKNVGTCHYTDPCHFLNTFKQSGSCPAQLTANGLPCTCPFDPKKLHLPPSKFTVTSIGDAWKFLADGNYHVKLEMKEKGNNQQRACFEAYITIAV